MAPSFRDPAGMEAMLDRFTVWMEVKGYSPHTLAGYTWGARRFIAWCEVRSVTRPDQVTRELVVRYARHLALSPGKVVERLSAASRQHLLMIVRAWFRWLSRQGHLATSPAAELEMPKVPEKLPHFLTAAEAERVLAVPDVTTPLGLRDRAMLEVLYSTGLRRAELAALELCDVELDQQTVRVQCGKGYRQRLVPIGRRAVYWVRRYLEGARPLLQPEPDELVVFLSKSGRPLVVGSLTLIARGYLAEAGVEKPGACHIFRHSMATAMLDGGADVRYIQQMLGHASLTTTQLYTQVAIRKLQEVHAKTHPAERPRMSRQDGDEGGAPPPSRPPARR